MNHTTLAPDMAELTEQPSLSLGDYLTALRRRRKLIAVVAGIVFLAGLVTAFVWPPTYESSSTVLIEEQEIPTELIQSTVTSYASQRIQVISQRVMTRTHLLGIVDKYDLYKSERKRKTIEEILLQMREDIRLNMVTADVLDPRTGRPTAATIAFNVGYQGEDPRLVQKVASELTTLFLNENLRTRTEKATETFEFLSTEADRLKQEIATHEIRVAEFKEQHINTLPDSRGINTESLARQEAELANLDTQIQSLKERKIYLEGQLPLLDPYSQATDALSPAARLALLQTEYIRLSSRYSPDHPDVTAIRREIRALEQETGIVSNTDELLAQLEQLRAELQTAEQNYTPDHPDVKNLKRQVASLEAELENATRVRNSGVAAAPDNPAYVNLQTQLAAVNSELKSTEARRRDVQEKIAMYEERLLQTPRVEQELRILSRDLLNATARYQDILAKQMTADIGREMEAERKGEKFTLIDPAVLPEEPVSPNRPAIIFIGFVLALGAGLGAAAARENLDTSVRGAKGVAMLLRQAPLAVIPYLSNTAEVRQQARRRWIITVAAVIVIVTIFAIIHYFFTPLDVIWFRGWRKVDNLMQ